MNKTLYIRDEDVPIWDRARELAGDKLSPVLMEALKQFVFMKEAQAAEGQGFERIIVTFRDRNELNLPKSKAFVGKWIIPPSKPHGLNEEPTYTLAGLSSQKTQRYHAVAITAKGRVVVYSWTGEVRMWTAEVKANDRTDECFEVFDSFTEAISPSAKNPGRDKAVFEAIKLRGLPVEELDI